MESTSETVLLFEVQTKMFGIPLNLVQEILPSAALSQLPGAHAALDGLLDLRGSMVPVFDLAKLLDLPSEQATYAHHFVVLKLQGQTVALRVNRALELATETAPRKPNKTNTKHISSVFKHNDWMVATLNIKSLSEIFDMNFAQNGVKTLKISG